MFKIGLAAATALALTGCASGSIEGQLGDLIAVPGSPSARAAAQRIYDTTCRNEPIVWVAVALMHEGDKISDKTYNRLVQAHIVISNACAKPPVDVEATVANIAKSYAEIAAYKAAVKETRPKVEATLRAR